MQGRSLLASSNEDHLMQHKFPCLYIILYGACLGTNLPPNHLLNYNNAVIIFLSQITDGSASNVDITAPGAIIALALISQGGPKNVFFILNRLLV